MGVRAAVLWVVVAWAWAGVAEAQARGQGGRRGEGDPAVAGKAPKEVEAAMEELWRRGRCLLSSVHQPAGNEAPVPKDIGTTPILQPRTYAGQGAILCHAVDGQAIWAADDQCLYHVDAAAGRLIKRYDLSDGLPDEVIQSIAVAGAKVHLATRRGLAELDLPAGRIVPAPEMGFTLARLTAGVSGVWLLSDAGAYRLAPGGSAWRRLPDPPGLERLAQTAERGFWQARWRRQMDALVPMMLANKDGLYVIFMDQLLRYDPAVEQWQVISSGAWSAIAQGRMIWALVTGAVIRYDPVTGKSDRFATGSGPAAGRSVALAAAGESLLVISQPDYDPKAKRFTGGGISRLDLTSGGWTVTEEVDGHDIRFVSGITADGQEVCAACTLYDQVVQLGAHPGMAHVKRWLPRACGMGLLHYRDGKWTLTKGQDLKTERRWVMGQKGTVARDRIGPESATALTRWGEAVWGVYRMVPEQYYAGYYVSAGRLAARSGGAWQGRFDARTDQLGLAGEHPELMLISHSHGETIVLAEGHPVVLSLEPAGGRLWAVCESGLCVYDEAADKFMPVVRQDFRMYWQPSAAAAGKAAVWIGGDGGSVSRLDRATGRVEIVGVVPGRKVTSVTTDGDRVIVGTQKTTVSLPCQLRGAPALPEADTIVYDGASWSAGQAARAAPPSAMSCRDKSSFLFQGAQRAGFLKGVFRPTVLCEDPVGGRLWLKTYSGLASVPLPAAAQ